MKTRFNKFLYIGFFILGLYQAYFIGDYLQAVAYFGIGLAFDPFDTEQKWNARPTWQKLVLIFHLVLIATLLGFEIGFNIK